MAGTSLHPCKMASHSNLCGVCHLAPGLCGCTCSTPPLPLCSSCMLLHIASPGSHVVESLPSFPAQSLPAQTSRNEFCAQCMNEVPETVCCCEEAGVVLCRGCIAGHNSKALDKMHIILPLKARNYVSTPGYLERLTRRQGSLNEGMKELRTNLKRVNKCEKKVVLRVEKLLKEANEYRDATLASLHEYRARLEQKLNETRAEIEAHIYEDAYFPGDPIARVIWNYTPGRLNLFNFTEKDVYKVQFQARMEPTQISPPSPVAKTNTPVQPPQPVSLPQQSPQAPSPQVKGPPTPSKASSKTPSKPPSSKSSPRPSVSSERPFISPLFCLLPNSLMFFSASSGTFTRKIGLTPPTAITQTASACLLPDGKVFVCGKKKPLSGVTYVIDPVTGQVSKLRDMLVRRFSHGLVSYGASAFAFGGNSDNGIQSSSEHFSVSSGLWTAIKNMLSPRSQFNPCLWGDFIYIFGGASTTNCEVFDILNNEYDPLAIRVPMVSQTSAALTADSAIVVVQIGRVFKWRIGDGRFEAEGKGPKKECWGNASPVVVGNKVYIPMFGKTTVKQVDIPA